MNVNEVLAEFRSEQRSLVWLGETLEMLPGVTRRCWDSGDINMVSAFALDEETVGEAIEEQVAYFGALGRSFEWKTFSYDQPPDLVERLRAAGFSVDDPEAIVVFDMNDGLEALAGPFDCEVRRIVSVEQLDDFRFVAEAAFGKDYSLTTNQLAEAIKTGEKGHDAYIGYIDGEPASIGRLYTSPQSRFAGLYGGGTRPEFRSRGCYRAIIAARARDVRAWGARYLQVDAMPTSRPILLRLGFTHIADTTPCMSPP